MADTASSTSNDSSPNKEKCCKKVKTENTDDKISKLPDAILSQILSSFPTKEAVRTSILSKQWRYIWTSVHNLDFDDQLFVHTKERQEVEIADCFRAFVTRVLGLHCVLSIQKLRFSCHRDYGFLCLTDWISAAITRNIKEIDVSHCVGRQVLPPKLFISENLVVLRLHAVALILPTSVHFPSLKILFLNCVKYEDDTSMRILLSGCPILEELDIIWKEDEDNVKTLYISSPSLKSLRVDSSCGRWDYGYKIVIESPNLQYLELSDRITEDFRVNKSPSLETVHLDIGYPETVAEDVYGDRLLDLLRIISNVKDLNITEKYFLYVECDGLPVFHNLRSLTLAFYEKRWDILFHLLDHSPNLQNFTIEKAMSYPCDKVYEVDEDCQWNPPSRMPEFLSSCLENFAILGFEDYDDEMEMLAYFLENATMLKKMVIVSRKLDLDNKSKLLEFPRSSSTCEIVVLVEIWQSPDQTKFW